MNNAGILAALEEVGYTISVLLEEFHALQYHHTLKHGEQYGAGHSFQKDLQKAKQLHSPHCTLAHVAYRTDIAMLTQLELSKLKGGVDRWLRYADNFYKLLLQDSGHMTHFGLSEEEMIQMQASVQALTASRNKHIACKGMAQNATQQRNKLICKLDARFALKEEPQLLEALGIMVRTPA